MHPWSTRELEAELAQSLSDLYAAQALERAAQVWHAREGTAESRAAYLKRKRIADEIRQEREEILAELSRRGGLRPGRGVA